MCVCVCVCVSGQLTLAPLAPAGLPAGSNTLNTLCALRAACVLSAGAVSAADPGARAAVLSDYVQFMTRPGSHNDTYAESFHRSFFCDWQELRPMSPGQVTDHMTRQVTHHMTRQVTHHMTRQVTHHMTRQVTDHMTTDK